MGDPAGVGPLVTVQALARVPRVLESHRIVVVGTSADLEAAARTVGCEWDTTTISLPHRGRARVGVVTNHLDIPPGRVGILVPEGVPDLAATPGHPTIEGGRAQLAFIDAALGLVTGGLADALVTGPVSKVSICRALGGESFTGHTEHLARAAGVATDAVTMIFIGPRLRVALVTTHLPLADVPRALTVDRIAWTLSRVVTALRDRWRIDRPRVVVLGLNPHAGEDGILGSEERTVIAPAIARFRASPEARGAEVAGPAPSETGIRDVLEGRFDCAVAMYHDQATIACKLLEKGRSVNLTLGLPFVRTSVDHGVAYDAAASGTADPGSMIAALELAARLTDATPRSGP
jgi:4-hydroxythreonine-4-phosphate dehydrogenase